MHVRPAKSALDAIADCVTAGRGGYVLRCWGSCACGFGLGLTGSGRQWMRTDRFGAGRVIMMASQAVVAGREAVKMVLAEGIVTHNARDAHLL